MFGKGKPFFAVVGFCVLGTLGCAKPNYQDGRRENFEQKTGETCSQKSDLCYQITWEKMPTENEVGSFQIQFNQDLKQAPAVVLWMPDMGHGSSPVKVEAISKSLYRIKDVFFVMPGAWQIKIQIKNGTAVDEIIQDIQI